MLKYNDRPNERTFEVTAENNTIGKRLKEGDIVTYTSERQARQASDSSPVRPRIHRVRLDLDWDNVTLSVPHFPSSSLSPSSPGIFYFISLSLFFFFFFCPSSSLFRPLYLSLFYSSFSILRILCSVHN